MIPAPTVAVIDIGSNSIKVLIASRGVEGTVVARRTRTIDARISAGLGQAAPQLTEAGMTRGLEAIEELLAEARRHGAERIALVATSAVRDAVNGREFCARVHQATGHTIRILAGEEEANLIGRGLTCDPALAGLRDFDVFDLGGGSLECLAFRNRQIAQAASLRLGCVRLTEMFVPHPDQPLGAGAIARVAAHVRETFRAEAVALTLPAGALAVGAGGTVTTARAILGARQGQTFELSDPTVSVDDLRGLLAMLSRLPLAERRQVTGLPPERADIFPVALATLIAVAELGGFQSYRNSLYNLRYGVADEALPAG